LRISITRNAESKMAKYWILYIGHSKPCKNTGHSKPCIIWLSINVVTVFSYYTKKPEPKTYWRDTRNYCWQIIMCWIILIKLRTCNLR